MSESNKEVSAAEIKALGVTWTQRKGAGKHKRCSHRWSAHTHSTTMGLQRAWGHSPRWAGPEPTAKLLFSREDKRFQSPFHTLLKDKYEPNSQSKDPGDPAVEAICHLAGEQLLGGASSDPDRSIRKGHSQRDNLQACRCDWTSTSRKPAYFMPVFCSSDIWSHKTAISIAMNRV